MSTVCVALLCLMVAAVTPALAAPHADQDNEVKELQLRQTAPMCTTNRDCYPDELANVSFVPSGLVECVAGSGRCFCSGCFEVNANENRCFFENPECYFYPTDGGVECVDNRRSQVTAFVLSLTLSSVGAANFYIGQNGLGGAQIFLFLFMFVSICCVSCLPCCTFCVDKDNSAFVFCGIICGIVIDAILLVAVMLAMWAWWIADAVIFGTNQRLAGDGCPLRPDL